MNSKFRHICHRKRRLQNLHSYETVILTHFKIRNVVLSMSKLVLMNTNKKKDIMGNKARYKKCKFISSFTVHSGTTHRVRQVRQPPYQNFFIVSSVLAGAEKSFTFCAFEWIINWKFQAKRLIHEDIFMIIVLFVSLA